jgi:hypothetical protein
MTNQIPLPGFAAHSTPAERIYVKLTLQWRKEFCAVIPSRAPPRSVDEISLAALLLAFEHGRTFTPSAWREAEENCKVCNERILPWVDSLPWRLAIAQFSETADNDAMEDLTYHLSHPTSSIRIWMMEIAWMVRPHLRFDEARQHLLNNVAGTLVGVRPAWGLAADLFNSNEDFLAAAERWQPEDFSDQYAERLTILKAEGSLQAQASFWRMESVCRRQITESAIFLA